MAFLSRLHPKKGLDILLPALADLPGYVTLDIYGDGEPAYLGELRSQVERRGLQARVQFRGPVSGVANTTAFTECDLFILPTHSENFGIVVAEALAHGTPVITTSGAPWAGLEREGCGRWTEISTAALVQAIADLDRADLPTMGARGRDWMMRDFSTSGMVGQFEKLYRQLSKRPSSER